MESVSGFLTGLQSILSEIHEKLMEQQELQIEMEFLFIFNKQLKRLNDLVEEFNGVDSIKTLHTFWRQLIR
ncbi:MAG: hypothetical protein QF371_08155, partial [Flavobacteriales bacterium]|nr:hypothetical protein [Flavobacteriales bacterium]